MIIDILQVSKYHETYPDAPKVYLQPIIGNPQEKRTGWVVYYNGEPHWFSNRGLAKKHMKSVTGKA